MRAGVHERSAFGFQRKGIMSAFCRWRITRRGGENAHPADLDTAVAANVSWMVAAEQHQQNGKTIRKERAKMQMETGLSRQRNGKPSRWFDKTNMMVLQNHHDTFCKPSCWFPVLMGISARSVAHPRPF